MLVSWSVTFLGTSQVTSGILVRTVLTVLVPVSSLRVCWFPGVLLFWYQSGHFGDHGTHSVNCFGARGGVVVKALRYKLVGRGFDSRWLHWNFSVT